MSRYVMGPLCPTCGAEMVYQAQHFGDVVVVGPAGHVHASMQWPHVFVCAKCGGSESVTHRPCPVCGWAWVTELRDSA